MEEALNRLVMEKMMRIESGYRAFLRRYSVPADSDMSRLAYYQMVAGVVMEDYLAVEDDQIEEKMLEELASKIQFYTSRIQNDIRKDIQL